VSDPGRTGKQKGGPQGWLGHMDKEEGGIPTVMVRGGEGRGGPGSRQHSSAVEAGAGGANRVAFPGKGNRGGPHLEERGGEWAGLKEKIPGPGPR
jgi:hypothetical protein